MIHHLPTLLNQCVCAAMTEKSQVLLTLRISTPAISGLVQSQRHGHHVKAV